MCEHTYLVDAILLIQPQKYSVGAVIAGLGSLIQTADAEAETTVFKFQRGEIDGDAFLKEYVEKKKVSGDLPGMPRCLFSH